MNTIKKIIIELDEGREFELTPEDAKNLRDALNQLFPVQPKSPDLYDLAAILAKRAKRSEPPVQIIPMPYPVPTSPAWPQPYRPAWYWMQSGETLRYTYTTHTSGDTGPQMLGT